MVHCLQKEQISLKAIRFKNMSTDSCVIRLQEKKTKNSLTGICVISLVTLLIMCPWNKPDKNWK